MSYLFLFRLVCSLLCINFSLQNPHACKTASLPIHADIVPGESPNADSECGEMCVSPLWEDVFHGAAWHDRCCVQPEEVLQDSYWTGAGGVALLSNCESIVYMIKLWTHVYTCTCDYSDYSDSFSYYSKLRHSFKPVKKTKNNTLLFLAQFCILIPETTLQECTLLIIITFACCLPV